MEGPKSPKRRTLLRRGLLVLAGVLGLAATERTVRGEGGGVAPPRPVGAPTSGTLRLYGRRWSPQVPAHLPGQLSVSDHVASYGELLDAPGGVRVGEFCTNGFCPETPYGHRLPVASNIEFQTFTLKDGSLFGIGAAGGGAEKTYAILGGTGRFAGVRGSYVARTTSAEPAGRSAVEFTLSLTA